MRKLGILLCGAWTLLYCSAHGWPSEPVCTRPNSTELRYWGDGVGLDKIYDALITCPNITSLDLDFDWAGCTQSSEPWAFQFKDGDRFPALRKLSLSDYDLNDTWRSNVWYQNQWSFKQKAVYAWKLIPPFFGKLFAGEFNEMLWIDAELAPPEESNLDKWLRAMDFSQLEDLRLTQHSEVFYQRMGHELPNLKTLQMKWINSGVNVSTEKIEFLRSIPPLESLSISIGPPYYYGTGKKNRTLFPIQTVIDAHGESLQRLALTQMECSEPNLRRPMLPVDQIRSIGASCSNLSHLTLDIDRDASFGWPNATLEALTSIINLESLKLRLELGTDLHDHMEPGTCDSNPAGLGSPEDLVREPRITMNVAEAFFQDLRASKAGKELHRAEFEVGDIEEKPYSGPIYMPSWDEGRARTFVCEAGSDTAPHCSMIDPNYQDDYDWFHD